VSQPDPVFSNFADLAARVSTTAVRMSEIVMTFEKELNELAEAVLLLAMSSDNPEHQPLDN
jgi:hypothetical protein